MPGSPVRILLWSGRGIGFTARYALQAICRRLPQFSSGVHHERRGSIGQEGMQGLVLKNELVTGHLEHAHVTYAACWSRHWAGSDVWLAC